MERSKTQLLTRDIVGTGVGDRKVTDELLDRTTLMAFGFIGSRALHDRHMTMLANPHPL